VLEPQALQRIRAMQQQGGPDILVTVIGIYLDNSVVMVDKVRAGIAAGDAKLICDAAHALKSSSANLGANTLSAIARQLEAMRRESDLSAALPLAERLFAEHARVVEALHNEMQRKATA
jgi:HPt (histidine-containing phosphotransfer) domain-containing protein